MSKRVKVIIGVVVTLVILWAIIFAIDYSRCANLKMPIFVMAGETADDGGSGTYYGLGYKIEVEKYISSEYGLQLAQVEMYIFDKFIIGAVAQINPHFSGEENETNTSSTTKIEELPENYSLTQAVKDECVISIHGLKMYNKDKLDTFLENVENNKTDFIRCISYTIEGDMVITDVNFEENCIFSICRDFTRDEYSSPSDRTYRYGKFSKIEIDESEEGTAIYLKEATEGEIQEIIIASYYKNAEIINDYESNFILKIEQSEEKEIEKITTDQLDEKYDYDIYYYGLESVTVEINNEEIELKEALLNNKITMEQIIKQAEQDSKNEFIRSDMYKDGGTMEYYYDTYTIIKSNSLNGNRDVYIGIPEMRVTHVR